MIKLAAIISLCVLTGQKDYIINGGFEIPFVPDKKLIKPSSIDGWYGKFELAGRFPGIERLSQFIDTASNSNGFIAQNVSLPNEGIYNLSF